MRVGLVCPYDLSKPGGVQAQVLGLASRLGDETVVIGPGLPLGVPGVDLGSTLSIPGNRSKVPVSVDPRVSGLIKEATSDLDLFHIHEPLMPTVSLAALHAGIPVVATFHAAPGPVGRSLYVLIGSQLNRVLGSAVRKVTAVSATAAAPLPDYLETEIIPNGVDVAAFGLDVDRHPLRVTFLGRDEPRKGLDVLLEAWPIVRDRVPEAELVVMGADRGTDDLTWMGRVDDPVKAETLCSSAVFVSPNTGGESFGITLVEAMSAGAAVVASDLGAFKDVGGEAVAYFPVGDVPALANSIVSLLQNPEERSRLGEMGRSRADQFDWRVVTGAYRRVYADALS